MISCKLFQTVSDRYTKSLWSYFPFIAQMAELIV